MRIEGTLARVPSRLAFWALAVVALFISHDAVYAVQVGPGESLTRALREVGHGYWGFASQTLGLVGLGAGLGVLARLHHLRRRASAIGADVQRPRWSRLPTTWLRLFAVVSAGFLLQENIEHAVTHMHAPGLGALLGPEYPLAIPVIGLITGLAALLATAVGGMERELLVAIAAALGHAFSHPRLSLPRPPLRIAARRLSPLALSMAGRAPPVVFAQHS